MSFATKLRIALRHLRSRAFQTFSVVSITAFSAGLAVALFLLVQGLRLGLVRAVEPFEIIVGAKGSPYQLALNTVFLQDVPVGNISWEDYAALSDDARVGFAVPLGFGDSYRGYPVVGTTPEVLNIRVNASAPPWLRLREGRWCSGAHFESVLGAGAAAGSGLRVGDVFRASHGVVAGDEHEGEYRVVGIAESVQGPYDRAIFVPLGAFWEIHAHGHWKRRAEEHGKEVTAILVHPNSYTDAYSLAVSFQRDADKQLIFPAQSVIRLFSLIGRGEAFLSVVVWAVGGSALLTALLVLYWSGAARGRERALLYVLGVPQRTLVFISWLEGTIALLAGVFLGELAGRAGAGAMFALLSRTTAVTPAMPLTLEECLAPAVFLCAGSLGTLAAALGGRTIFPL
ncbi:MAG: ABC transporter permease [Synergistaceae bacterium]|nr:ABC transporter permease [Synergistaceae bacterium]